MAGPECAVVCRASYPVTPDLEPQSRLWEGEVSNQRIIEIEGLTRVSFGVLLWSVKLVHLEGREGAQVFVARERKRLARGNRVCPVSGADVIAGIGGVAPGRREKAIEQTDRDAFLIPPEDEWHVVRIGETAAAPLMLPVDVQGKIVAWQRAALQLRSSGLPQEASDC